MDAPANEAREGARTMFTAFLSGRRSEDVTFMPTVTDSWPWLLAYSYEN